MMVALHSKRLRGVNKTHGDEQVCHDRSSRYVGRANFFCSTTRINEMAHFASAVDCKRIVRCVTGKWTRTVWKTCGGVSLRIRRRRLHFAGVKIAHCPGLKSMSPMGRRLIAPDSRL